MSNKENIGGCSSHGCASCSGCGHDHSVVAEATEEEKEDIEVVILEIKTEGEEEVYDTVTDEKLAERVFNEFVSGQNDEE